MAISPDIESGPYIGNGAQTAFVFGFTAIMPAEVAVELDGVAQSAGFSVTLADVGGTVTFATPPASGARIVLRSSPDYLQDSAFENEGAYNLATVNTINRRQTVRSNWLYRKVAAALAINKGDKGDTGAPGEPGPEGPIGGSVFPDGTVQRFVDLVTAAGTTVSSTAQAALLTVEYQLRQSGLLPKIVRLNLRCGVGVAAARIPFVQRYGCGATSDTGTISIWNEANGLSGATVNTGVTLRQFGGSGYNLGLWQYFLTDNGGGDLSYTIGASDGAWGFSPRYAHEANPSNPAFGVAIFTTFAGAGVARGDLTRRIAGINTYPMLGTLGATRDASGMASFHRNGIMLTGAAPAVDQPNPDTGPPAQAISVFTANAASGGEAITDALTPAEAAMLHIIVHGFNVAIGRGVTAEGL